MLCGYKLHLEMIKVVCNDTVGILGLISLSHVLIKLYKMESEKIIQARS